MISKFDVESLMHTEPSASTPAYVMRPVALTDLDDLVRLADRAAFGLTTLPRDHAFLQRRIEDSLHAFQLNVRRPGAEAYLLALENIADHRVVGVSGVFAKVGGYEPFYAYRIESSVHASTQLQVRKEVKTLHLASIHDGPSEIGSLLLDPDARGHHVGRLLSLSRFLMIACHPHRFETQVLAEMRGVVDDHGHSPFWDAVGKTFFDIDFLTADYLSIVNKRFIADLMPTHPIYIPLLPPEARAIIGQVHPHTQPALRMLEDEGFQFDQMVDIFEAGPIVTAAREQIRSIRKSTVAKAAIDNNVAAGEQLICSVTDDPAMFRACQAPIQIVGDKATITPATAATLEVEAGELLRFVPPRAARIGYDTAAAVAASLARPVHE